MSLIAVAVGGRGLVDPAAPVFRADDEALLRGSVAFETLRVYRGRPFMLDRHLDRLDRSIAGLGLPAAHGAEALVEQVLAAAPPDCVLRLYRSDDVLVATVAALPQEIEAERARGIALCSFRVGRPLLGDVKSTSYAERLAARRHAVAGGADEALLVSDVVLETATANVFWRRGETLYTPSIEAGVLGGVTRGVVCEEAETVEGSFPLEDLIDADEAFTTSSIREVIPVVAVDGRPIGSGRPGPAAARAQAALRLRCEA